MKKIKTKYLKYISINGRFKNYLERKQYGKFTFKKLKRSRTKTI